MPKVYKITNLLDGKFYIGITNNTLAFRFNGHVKDSLKPHINRYLTKAMIKHGKEFFKIDLLKECDSWEIACLEEIRLISCLKPQYNLTKGGDGWRGIKTETTKLKWRLTSILNGGFNKSKRLAVIDTLKNVIYQSSRIAARFTGIPDSTIRYQMRRNDMRFVYADGSRIDG